MALKEIYEEMSNEELLDRYKDFQDYRDEAKAVILEELRKRKIVSKEEIEKKLNSFRKYEQEKVKEEKKVEAKSKENIKDKNAKNYFALRGIGGIFLILLMMGSGIFVDSFLTFGYGVATLSWKETKAKIINFNTEKRMVKRRDRTEEKVTDYYFDYVYNVDGIKYENNQMSAGKIEEIHYRDKIGKNLKDGDELVIYYNPKNYSQSIVVKYSLKTSLLEFFSSVIILLLFYLGILKYESDYGEKVSKKFISYMFLLFCVIFICMMLMGEAFSWVIALMFLAWIGFIIFEFGKMFIMTYFN